MNGAATLVWLSNVAFDVAGHLAFKHAARRSSAAKGLSFWRSTGADPFLWLGLAALAVEFVLWFAFLALVPLSVAVLVGSINILGVMIGGRLLFGEQITLTRGAAVGLIVAGVVIVGWGGR
jgi:drug/metabolite transporter (DMT)-like permease